MLRKSREAECYPVMVSPIVLMQPCMPYSRFQTNKGVWLNFYFKRGFLLKRLKPMTFPWPALPPCGCLRRARGMCAWMCTLRRCCGNHPEEKGTRIEHTGGCSHQKSTVQIQQTRHATCHLKILLNSAKPVVI